MTTRGQQIEAVTGLMVDVIESSAEGFELDDARYYNQQGWTFETSAPLGHTMRHEGVVLGEGELRRAYTAAWERAFDGRFVSLGAAGG